jgi:3-deoxy-D-manno-octulosonic-acid transferase
MQILLVKTSSLGDVVHNLPVVSDLRRRLPEANLVQDGRQTTGFHAASPQSR